MLSLPSPTLNNMEQPVSQPNPLADFVVDMAPDFVEIPETEPISEGFNNSGEDINFDFGSNKEDETKRENSQKESDNSSNSNSSESGASGGSSGITAKMYVETVDLLVSKFCGALADKPSSLYVLDADEKKHYRKITEEYFKTVDVNVSPTAVFVLTSLALFGPNIFIAVNTRSRMNKAKKSFATNNGKGAIIKDFGNTGNFAKSKPSQPVFNYDEMNASDTQNSYRGEIPIHGVPEMNIPPRTNFELTGSDYKYDRYGGYAKKEEREPAHEEVRALWKKGFRSKEIQEKFGIA